MGLILFKFSRVEGYALSTEIYSCYMSKSCSSINKHQKCMLFRCLVLKSSWTFREKYFLTFLLSPSAHAVPPRTEKTKFHRKYCGKLMHCFKNSFQKKYTVPHWKTEQQRSTNNLDRCMFSGFALESAHVEVTGGMQNKNIALETGIKIKEMGCFLFRNKFLWFFFPLFLGFFFNRFYSWE